MTNGRCLLLANISSISNRTDPEKEAAESNEKELQVSEKQVRQLQKQIDKLKADLEVERARVRPPTPEVSIFFRNLFGE